MPLNWIDVREYSFNSFLMLERFQIRMMFDGRMQGEWKHSMAIALRHNPAVAWYFAHKCPECAVLAKQTEDGAPDGLTAEEIRQAEVFCMRAVEDFITYTTPEVMDTHCDFIQRWDKQRLLELTDFRDKVVLDVGSGSGRLAFSACEYAREVYASEPVDSLREYLRDKVTKERIPNMRVVDGMADRLAYPDNTFDIVMSGHVVGDDYDAEMAELMRVVKPGGWILDCPGEAAHRDKPDETARQLGWEEFYYLSPLGGDVYRYRKQIFK